MRIGVAEEREALVPAPADAERVVDDRAARHAVQVGAGADVVDELALQDLLDALAGVEGRREERRDQAGRAERDDHGGPEGRRPLPGEHDRDQDRDHGGQQRAPRSRLEQHVRRRRADRQRDERVDPPPHQGDGDHHEHQPARLPEPDRVDALGRDRGPDVVTGGLRADERRDHDDARDRGPRPDEPLDVGHGPDEHDRGERDEEGEREQARHLLEPVDRRCGGERGRDQQRPGEEHAVDLSRDRRVAEPDQDRHERDHGKCHGQVDGQPGESLGPLEEPGHDEGDREERREPVTHVRTVAHGDQLQSGQCLITLPGDRPGGGRAPGRTYPGRPSPQPGTPRDRIDHPGGDPG